MSFYVQKSPLLNYNANTAVYVGCGEDFSARQLLHQGAFVRLLNTLDL